MGINNLKKFIREKNLICQKKLSDFAEKKLAIDISSYIYKYKITFGDKWISSFVNMVCCLRENLVHGVFIFDGKPPVEKTEENNKRKEIREKSELNVSVLNKDVDDFSLTGKISQRLIDLDMKISTKSPNKVSGFLKNIKKERTIDIEAIKRYISKKEEQNVKIEEQDISKIKELLTSFCIPYYVAEGEAEALCAFLYKNGKVNGVITEDSDILAYGVEIYLSSLNISTGECECVFLSEVLENFEMNPIEFLDFCIMCGTDYNKNIPMIGTKKSYDIIRKYKTIEKYGETVGPDKIHILNKDTVRELFNTFGRLTKTIDFYTINYWNSNLNFKKIQKTLEKNDCVYLLDKIRDMWNPKIQFC